ncbi:MAG: hypothetical protein MK161_16895, partial [Pirellulales bacterium]|nr:hypothetical protein [Pirellulales bacterium]
MCFLTLALSAGCGPQVNELGQTPDEEAAYQCNPTGDRVADDLGTTVDENLDGYPDVVGKTESGLSYVYWIDANFDGYGDYPGWSLNDTCVVDAVDQN